MIERELKQIAFKGGFGALINVSVQNAPKFRRNVFAHKSTYKLQKDKHFSKNSISHLVEKRKKDRR